MGDKNQGRIDTHHRQVTTAKQRREAKQTERQTSFESRRNVWKQRVEEWRQAHETAILVFFIGLYLLAAIIVYALGGIVF